MKARFVAAAVAAGILACGPAYAADILVTVTIQRVTGGPGCSLQEAIFSANFDENKSIVGIDSLGNPLFKSTSCVPGSGADRIILPFRASFPLGGAIDDPMNPLGPGGTPMVDSEIVIEGNGSKVYTYSGKRLRAFAVGASGSLTVNNLMVSGFAAQGGSGGNGGGGGMGAGGAVFVRSGTLIARNSTFADNWAIGGYGGVGALGGGGGGLGGNGGNGVYEGGGGGGGGARGHGQNVYGHVSQFGGAGGGTTWNSLRCGGVGGSWKQSDYNPLQNGQCDGGGGGGGGSAFFNFDDVSRAGHGAYGGGGGGAGGHDDGNGGAGGFGGGGGSANKGGLFSREDGGNGGFGGGGGTGSIVSDAGQGGIFGGDAGSRGGGGGAGLGGAIFSDGGTIVLENSTLTGNYAMRGEGGIWPYYLGGTGQYGEGRGGAVFSFGGRLILRNTTVADNRASSSDSGIVMYKQFFLNGHSMTVEAELNVSNSIIANNTVETGLDEPQCRGVGLVPAGVGNLIHNETNCAGVVRTGDPLLGPLSLNSPGNTPTMAITSNASEAFNTADPATSLPLDQRGMPRPKQSGFDIGAFERCVSRPEVGVTCTLPIFEIPESVLLTTFASPSSGGSVTPATGSVPLGSVQQLVATPAAGWMFAGWTGDPVGNPASASTFIGMDSAHVVIANFATWTARPAGRATPGSATTAPRVDLTWLGAGGVDHYDVYRGTVSGGPYVVVGSSTTTAFSDRTAGLSNGGTYYYVVQAVAADGTVIGKSSEAVVKIPVGR